MPIIVSNVTDRARIRLADIAGEIWDDQILVQFAIEAYEEAGRFLRGKGMHLFRRESNAISVASGTKSITRTGGTAYPSDLVRPIEIRWRPAGAGAWETTPLRINDGFFQDAAVDAKLRLYDWRDDTIFLGSGANVNTEVQIQYEADLPAIDDPGDAIRIPNSLSPLALLTAAYAADSRDEFEHSDRWDKLAHTQLEYIAAAEQHVRRSAAARWQGQ